MTMVSVIELFAELVMLMVFAMCLPAIIMFVGAFKLLDWLCRL